MAKSDRMKFTTRNSFSDETDEPKANVINAIVGLFFLQSLSAFDVLENFEESFLAFSVFMESDLNKWGCVDYSLSGFLDPSGKDGDGFSDMLEEGSVLSGEAMVGLKLGRQTYRQEKSRTNVSGSSYSLVKRSRGSHHGSGLPRCQVEGCNLDLASAKDYHRRHKICVDHSKSPQVVVAGMERRFCQQCSRLHDLSEFDDGKRSCRRRLSAHNARRRKPRSEDTTIDRRPHMGFLVNRLSISSSGSTPRSCPDYKGGRADMMSNGGLSDVSSCFHGMRVNRNGLEASSSSINAMEVHHSFSHETASSWGFRGHEEPSSFDQFIHGQNIGLAQPGMPLEMQSTNNNAQMPHDFDCFSSD
ncbi:hypothetical protein SSX86_002987 [Deinandra increscens subsp. villosa]|uniref:SBP-type domain-containing protein n=1 Tax=Deinandra increscens subsp. villosa TaxID=3103831 RepID=A0AAP0H8H4_9ASTR